MATDFQNVPDYSKLDLSLPCNTDLSALQYRAVKITSAEIVVAGSGAQADGILQNAPSTSGPNNSPIASVRAVGCTKYIAGGAITGGQYLMPNTNGDGSLIPVVADKDKFCLKAIGDCDSGNIGIAVVCFGEASM